MTRILLSELALSQSLSFPAPLDKGNEGSGNEIEFTLIKDGAYFRYCACVLCFSRYSGFLWVMATSTNHEKSRNLIDQIRGMVSQKRKKKNKNKKKKKTK